MPILVCGINHKTAPLALREKLIFATDKLPLYLMDLREQLGIEEAVILSTCNRSELYCQSDDADAIVMWFCKQHQLSVADIQNAFYIHQDQCAVQHIMSVACGLDSMILGESQILGQMKTAFAESSAANAVGNVFHRLFQMVFSVAKEVRSNTAIGACPVSVASATVGLAKKTFASISDKRFLVIGAGHTANLVLRYLKAHQVSNITIVNRSDDNAATLATVYSAVAYPFIHLDKALQSADIVISATGSVLPIVTRQLMQKVLGQRADSICFIDIAVPRDIEASVATLDRVQLFCIDDLKNIIEANVRGREHAAEKAREVITLKSAEFVEWMRSLDLVAMTIKAYRRQVEKISQGEFTKAARQLQRGDDPLQVLASFSHALTNKLLHTPSVQLRQAGAQGRMEMLQLAQELFAITD